MNKEKIAKFLSIVLGPQFWLPLLLIITILKTELSYQQQLIILPALLLFQLFIPGLYVLIMLKIGKVSSWDLPKRQERYLFLAITFISYLISFLIIIRAGNPLLFNISIIELALLLTISIITAFWKISIHTSVTTASTILINFLFNWQLPFLYLTIPAIFWARLFLKRHTINQLFAGIIISTIIALGLLSYF